MLNLNACLNKAGVEFSTIWSKDFRDDFFRNGIREWLKNQRITHDQTHVRAFNTAAIGQAERELGQALARDLKMRKAILGVFDEGCMGMYNAIIPDDLLQPRPACSRSGSASRRFIAAMRRCARRRGAGVRDWLERGHALRHRRRRQRPT